MPAPKGNDFNMKWKTKAERQEAFEAVYQHLSSGFSRSSFPLSDWDTVERYMRDFPEDFPAEKIAEAMRANALEWERIGMDGARGKIAGFNAAAWIFNMKNRFKEDWRDKHDIDHQSSDGSMTPKDTGAAVLEALARKHGDADT